MREGCAPSARRDSIKVQAPTSLDTELDVESDSVVRAASSVSSSALHALWTRAGLVG